MEFDIFSHEQGLASYALRSSTAAGDRRVVELSHPFRSPFQRDRDRVIHSRAFRRLDGKTQVFLSGSGDHYRTRLTHTIEVVGLARTMARRLSANEDLTEAIALAHDLGHTPFGHVGEQVLDRQLRDVCGGFDHNDQALRVVDLLEEKYPAYDGLNLCREVRRGLVKHRHPGKSRLDGRLLPPQLSLEAQIADVADELAYYGHDVDDGLEAGLLTDQCLLDSVRLWRMARDSAQGEATVVDRKRLQSYTVRCLINMLAEDVIGHSLVVLQQIRPGSPEQIQEEERPIVGFSPKIRHYSQELRRFLFRNLYQHSEILAINRRMGKVVDELYFYLISHPACLGTGSRQLLSRFGRERTVADYIAGMTDSFARQSHQDYCLP